MAVAPSGFSKTNYKVEIEYSGVFAYLVEFLMLIGLYNNNKTLGLLLYRRYSHKQTYHMHINTPSHGTTICRSIKLG